MRSKRDGNHSTIAKAYTDAGCSVFDAHKVGQGFPDLVVGIAGRTYLVEVKNPAGRNRVEKSQTKFSAEWRGSKPVVVRSVADVAEHVSDVRSRWALDHCG